MSRARSLSRRYAVQALYQWQLTGQAVDEVCKQFVDDRGLGKADKAYFSEILFQVVSNIESLDEILSPYLDRSVGKVDPVERAILRLGICELSLHEEIPYKVVLNEAVELAKMFGSQNGHKYINGILDQAVQKLREKEVS
ncbi:MAG: transcription antitermination factor NusB [Gammaproteobacteria bacterium]